MADLSQRIEVEKKIMEKTRLAKNISDIWLHFFSETNAFLEKKSDKDEI